MNHTTRNALLLFGGALTLGLIPMWYARYRRHRTPASYTEEQRQRNRLSVQLDADDATELHHWRREAA